MAVRARQGGHPSNMSSLDVATSPCRPCEQGGYPHGKAPDRHKKRKHVSKAQWVFEGTADSVNLMVCGRERLDRRCKVDAILRISRAFASRVRLTAHGWLARRPIRSSGMQSRPSFACGSRARGSCTCPHLGARWGRPRDSRAERRRYGHQNALPCRHVSPRSLDRVCDRPRTVAYAHARGVLARLRHVAYGHSCVRRRQARS